LDAGGRETVRRSAARVMGKAGARYKGGRGEIRAAAPYKRSEAASDGSPSAALEQPHLVTTTH